MTVNEIVSLIRGLLKENDRSDGVYTDRFLWTTFVVAKAEVISNFRLRRFNYKNPQNYIPFCLELEQAKSHVCGCITYGCDVLVTKNKLPKFFSGRNTPSLRISTLGNTEIDLIEETEYEEVYRYNDIYKDKTLASIVDNKIVLWNDLDSKVIQVKALWEDITEISDVQFCSDSSSSTPNCIDVFNKDIGIDKDLIQEALRRTFELLNIPLQLQEDLTNNSNSNE